MRRVRKDDRGESDTQPDDTMYEEVMRELVFECYPAGEEQPPFGQ
jgi:hypothetical protein